MKGDKVLCDEEVYYKENRTILLRGDVLMNNWRYILRNTWTGEEKDITAEEAKVLMKKWKVGKRLEVGV